MRLGEPLALFALVLCPLILAVHVWLERRRARRVGAAGDPALLEALILSDPGGGRRRRLLQAVLLSIGAAFVALALARPQLGMRTEVRKARGLDLVIALDLSRSMLAQDVVPSRLQRAKLELSQLAAQLGGDRIGLVGFTSVALPLCPVTIDHSALELQLESANPKDFPRGGTAIAEAIEASQRMLDGSKKTGGARAILVVTDGEENEGAPAEAAKKAREAGIEVHVAGVGSRTGEPIPVYGEGGRMEGYLKDNAGQTVVSRLNEEILRKVADAGGGLVALPGESGGLDLGPVRAHLATMKRADLQDRTIRVYEERYQWLLAPALLFLFAGTLLRPTRPRARIVVRGLGQLVLVLGVLLAGGDARAAGPLEREDPDAREGNEHLAAGRAKEAITAYERALGRLGEDPRLVFNRGLAAAQAGELDRAISDLKVAMEGSKDPALRGEAAYALGNAYRKLKKWDEAIGAYKRALLEDPRQSGARKNLEIARRQKLVEALQPRDPNQKNEGDKPPPPSQDGGTGDGGSDGGSGDGGVPDATDSDGGNGNADGGGSEPPDAGSGASSDSGSGAGDGGSAGSGEDASSGGDGGEQPAPQPQEQPKEQPEDGEQKDVSELLDALQEQEKVLQRKRLLQKVKAKTVEKDW